MSDGDLTLEPSQDQSSPVSDFGSSTVIDGDLTPKALKVPRQRPDKIARTHRYLHENGFLKTAEPYSFKKEQRRAVTSTVAVLSYPIALQADSASILRRQPSLKHRLLNRMVSGFSSKPIGNNHNEPNNPPSTQRPSRDDSRNSTESSVSTGGSLIDLDRALASFPTTPTSAATTPKTERSFKSTPSPVQRHNDLSTPQKSGILAAEIKVVPCHDRERLDYDNAAVIEISAKVHGNFPNIESQFQRNALDVAVVIDNSLFNCPALLMTSCEVTRILASFLDSTIDRIAILCSMSTGMKQENHDTNGASELKWVNPKNLKATLDSIASSTVQPDAGVLIESVKRAQHILRDSERVQVFGSPSYQIFGHVVVLTADASSLCGEDLKDDTIQTHVLSTGIPKNRDWDKVECNGWKMYLLDPLLAGGGHIQSRSKKDHHSRSLSNKMQALIQHARTGQLTDCLTDVIVDLDPQVGCTKERVLGRTRFPRLQIGETKTVVVSLISEFHSTNLDFAGDSNDHGYNFLNTDDDLMVEIGSMLEIPKDKMLTVHLTYRHSSMPKNTVCTASAKCLIQMQSPPSNYRQSVRKHVASKGTVLLHQRLAEYYAAYYTPRDALTSLRQEFGDEGSRSACPRYINALADELKYQARISERIAIENSPKKPLLDSPLSYHTARSRKSSRKSENYKPSTWTKESDSEPHTPDESQTEVIEQLGLDDARKIWSDLRYMSKGEHSDNIITAPISPSLQSLQEQSKLITEITLRGQKSAGELKPRSFVEYPQRVTKSTLFPPWF